MTRLAMIAGVGLLLLACGGGGERGNQQPDRDALEDRFMAAYATIANPEADLSDLLAFVATDCRGEVIGAPALGRELVRTLSGADSEWTIRVRAIDFDTPTRAFVTSELLVDGDPVPDDDGPDQALWIYEDGEWRGAANCAFYGTRDDE